MTKSVADFVREVSNNPNIKEPILFCGLDKGDQISIFCVDLSSDQKRILKELLGDFLSEHEKPKRLS